MEIFNIHIFEFLLIAGLALVVFGPERLPEVGRFIGQQVAKFLAWQQQSPELQMLNEVRAEFEREIAELRDELVRTRQQLDISRDVSSIKDELRPMLDLKGNMQLPGAEALNGAKTAADAAEPSIAPPDLAPADAARQAADVALPEPPAEALEAAAELVAPEPPLTVRPAAQTVPAAAHPNRVIRAEPTTALGVPAPPAGDQQFAEPPPPPEPDERVEYLRRKREGLHDAPEPEPAGAPPAPTPDDRDELLRRLQSLAGDLQALTAELQQRGVLRPDWQLPAQPPEQETMSR